MKLFNKFISNKSEIFILAAIFFLFPFVYSITFKQTSYFLKYPLIYEEDGLWVLTILKGIMQNGWYLENKYLAAPFTQLLYDFPVPEVFFLTIAKILGALKINHFVAFNILFYLSYSMTGVSSFFIFRKFGVSAPLALAGSFVFTFLPYHQLRLNHLFLASYFSVPIYIYFAFQCFNSEEKFSIGNKLLTAGFLVLSATTGSYYAFFGCFFIFVAGLANWKQNGSFYGFKRAFKFIAIIVVTVIVCVSPNLIWQKTHGKNPVVASRNFAESELYGMKIAQLVLPVQGHRLGQFSNQNKLYSISTPSVNENATSSLGLIGTIGFLGLIFLLFKFKSITILESFASRLNIAGILLSSIGGFGVLFAFYITPQFRGLNRISVFISFLSILYFCFIIQNWLTKKKYNNVLYNVLPWIVSAVLIFFSYWDQISFQHAPGIVHRYKMFESNDAFFKKLESTLPQNSMIYQLPYVRYPESPMAYKEGSYGLILPNLHSNKLRWSYGQMGYTSDDIWASTMSSLSMDKRIEILKDFNFAGILIDRFGYKDNGIEIENTIIGQTHIEPITSSDNRYAFFNIANVIQIKNSNKVGALAIFPDDWYQPEVDDKSKWIWSKKKSAKIDFQTLNRTYSKCEITFSLQSSGSSKITLKSTDKNLKNEIYDFNKASTFDVSINLNIASEGTSLIFESDSNPIQLDPIFNRLLSFRIINLKFCDQTY